MQSNIYKLYQKYAHFQIMTKQCHIYEDSAADRLKYNEAKHHKSFIDGEQ